MLESSQSTVSENPTSTANSVAEKSTNGSSPNRKCQGKVPKKIHKAEREKLKRDQLNDLFLDLGNLLEPDRQNSGKASILGDTTRILRDLLSQVESLRKENAALQTESHYVTTEKNEIKDENAALHTQITELRNELQARMGYDHPVWTNHADSLSRLAAPHPAISIQPPHHHNRHHPQQLPQHPPAVIGLVCPTPPRELQLFPVSEPAREEVEAPSNVRRPQVRYPATLDSWPGQLLRTSLIVTRTQDEQCSSTGLTLTTNSVEENPR